METQEITPEWVKENLCMDDENDITECYLITKINQNYNHI